MGNFFQRGRYILDQFVTDGIAFVWTIEGNRGDSVVVREMDSFVVHFNRLPLNSCTSLRSRLSPAGEHQRISAAAELRPEPSTPQPLSPWQYFRLAHLERTGIHQGRPAPNRIADSRHHTLLLFSPQLGRGGYAGELRSPDSHTSQSLRKPLLRFVPVPPSQPYPPAKSCARHKIRGGQ